MFPPIALFAVLLAAAQSADLPPDTAITLERTACYGTCPVYTVTIDAQGNVTYEGKEHVRVTGQQRARIPVARVAALVETAQRIGFFELRDRYVTMRNPDGTEMVVSDLPTAFTTITSGGRTKRIENYVGAPAELRKLEDAIDDAANTRQWIALLERALVTRSQP